MIFMWQNQKRKVKGETKSDKKETTGSEVPFQAKTCQAGELSNVYFIF